MRAKRNNEQRLKGFRRYTFRLYRPRMDITRSSAALRSTQNPRSPPSLTLTQRWSPRGNIIRTGTAEPVPPGGTT
ncbi:hypothetical protein GCM10012285_41980 [Streptomyces kronopolitis]|uniref:Uncharacterized protein n=1 Tax=Streptomyces kronopolitis TaxID=1612435 RepID=A0ABQ2JMJ3_9ACTN|nr:hypothetical protein GCM10012285_41980 [Streptomyces kronopolitis]